MRQRPTTDEGGRYRPAPNGLVQGGLGVNCRGEKDAVAIKWCPMSVIVPAYELAPQSVDGENPGEGPSVGSWKLVGPRATGPCMSGRVVSLRRAPLLHSTSAGYHGHGDIPPVAGPAMASRPRQATRGKRSSVHTPRDTAADQTSIEGGPWADHRVPGDGTWRSSRRRSVGESPGPRPIESVDGSRSDS
jgi:hypothetical protein